LVQLRAGDRIDHYTLLMPVGEGGQGSVWKAIDPRDGGMVRALKLAEVDRRGGQSFERMRREAKLLAASQHPGLVGCHGFFEDMGRGLVGMVMDLVPGVSLAAAADEKRLDRDHCFAILEQLASALAYVHHQGLVHRDIKPDNVVLTHSFWASPRQPGAVKLVDFGIAAPTDNLRPLTSEGAVMGTIPYMAPELIDQATWGRAEGPARDIFAFGVLAWEILFGQHPTGLSPDASMSDYAQAYKATHAGHLIVWPPRGLDGPWGAAVGASLALRPSDRAADGADVLAILRTGSAPLVGHAPRASAPPIATLPHKQSTRPIPAPMARYGPDEHLPKRSTARRIRGWAIAGLLFVVAMAAGAAASIASGIFESGPTPPPLVPPAPSIPSAPPSAAPSVPPSAALMEPMWIASNRQEPSACCRPGATCIHPRNGTKFACPPCLVDAPLLPRAHGWLMRVSNIVDPAGHNLASAKPSSTLCMLRGGQKLCLPFARIASQQFRVEERLLVTTEDVEGGGISFSIDGGTETRGLLTKPWAKSTALCEGLSLYLGNPNEDPVVKIGVYLDPTSEE
jgi:eukaryotic-like serine/threonine-protein kinase